MEQVELQFTWLDAERDKDLQLPRYETKQSAGMDVSAAVTDSITIKPGEIVLVPTGFAVGIADGYEIQIRPRSGLAIKHGISLPNTPGTIDADYRGEVKVGLINLSAKSFVIERGDRIAQMVLSPIVHAKIKVVNELDTTERGSGGFGHTGIR